MNSTINTLLSHRSIRSFTEQAIEPKLLDTLLECGFAASSSSFIQCVSVIRITLKDSRTKLAQYAGGQPYVEDCAEFLVFCADFHRHQRIHPQAQLGFSEQTLIGSIDAAMVAQNCLTAAESLGLGGVYIGGLRNNPQQVTDLLALPKHVLPLFGLCLGYPNQQPEIKPRLPQSIVLHQETYQAIDKNALALYDAHIQQYYATRTDNKKAASWSEQITQILSKEARPFMHDFLQQQGFNTK